MSGESAGAFVGLPSMEWNTNSAGNHVNILGSREVAKTMRDRFDHMWNDFMPSRAHAGDIPMVQLNHPRTFRRQDVSLDGNWDQIFGVNLLEVPNNSDRNKKFNDYGLDDFEPMLSARQDWLLGTDLPDESVVRATLANLRAAAGPHVRMMEVTVGRGNELGSEQAVNPSLVTDPETGEVSRFTRVHTDWDYYLLAGFALAPTAPHDNHMANWGTGHTSRTAIVARALSEDTLLHAIDARALYASEDENLTLRFYAEGRVPMGGRLRTTKGNVAFRYKLEDPDYDGAFRVNLVVGTVGQDAVAVIDLGTASEGAFLLASHTFGPGEHFAYLEVTEVDANRMAWSAPIFIESL